MHGLRKPSKRHEAQFLLYTRHAPRVRESTITVMLTAMSSFNKISEDLLYYIALNIERDLSTLSSLSLVCRTFHRATRALLFRHIGRLSSDKSQLLQRSLAENPDLKAHVRSHHIELKDGNLEHDHLKKALVYPNINELTISRYIPPVGVKGDFIGTRRNLLQKFWYGRSVERDFECEFLDNNDECPFAEIQSISLKQDFTTTEIIRFMLLPSGQVLRASDLDIMKEARLPVAFAAAKSNVTELELLSGRLWRIEPVAMRSILSFCPHLRVLRCQVPMETKFNGQDEITSEVIRPVSPKSLNAMFEPVRDTLQELSLLNLRHTVPYDGSRMDLSGFRALRDLEVTSCCLLRPGAPCVEWEGLGDSLPVGLRKLKVRVLSKKKESVLLSSDFFVLSQLTNRDD